MSSWKTERLYYTYRLYQLFLQCRCHGDIEFNDDTECHDIIFQASVGNFLGAFEIVSKIKRLGRKKFLFSRALDIYAHFIQLEKREKRFAKLDQLELLLEKGYLEAARFLVNKITMRDCRWRESIAVYRHTKNPIDAQMIRKWVTSSFQAGSNGLLSVLQETAMITGDSRDLDRAARYLGRFESLGSETKVVYWARRYRATRKRSDLEKAKSFARSLTEEGAIRAWKVVCEMAPRSSLCRKELSLAERRLRAVKRSEVPASFADCLRLLRETGNSRFAQMAMTWIREEPNHRQQEEMIMKLLSGLRSIY